ncbi:Fe-S cluster assembly protein SufD [Xylella fastidiosa subsp. pauca]|uniref:Fe-S cluster assembly protein SufD n=2 Tax=Xylella fastidiosa TaxID=2371 RepID=UPI00058272F9|nr:Fe-S cluster assembly protein SufD [Xylella fastidiosa]ARO68887.1 Fe-S cluster assembly protein SufD [Xylella fastidiosa subsp. pauca]AVI20951.1 Fe-S cluster assembly protein SufD [Xylella fastidiosa]AVI22979.1 Fe-S cluster assembly protein SufD [Xylella fastidiosa]KIA58204.1 ABC transporter permease [Xylella fastidiosa]KXB10169.1 ABC transporter permease [Xylella fastidiosa]
MNPLLDSLAAAFQNDGDITRRQALEDARRDGLPDLRSETWKYTSLRTLERRHFSQAPTAATTINPAWLNTIPTPRLVFINGRHSPSLSNLSGLPQGITIHPLSAPPTEQDKGLHRTPPHFKHRDETFARLNTALADEGVLLRVHQNITVNTPIHLIFITPAGEIDHAWHLRNQIELHRGASLQLIEHQLHTGHAAHLNNVLTRIHLAPGACLEHARLQNDATATTSFLRTDAVLAQDAEYRRVDVELGATLSRHELNVRLEGDNARLTANGILLGHLTCHLDTRLHIEHIARNTASELLWRGIGTDRSRVVFHGGIHIHQGADGSDARLSNKNLLLSANAEIDTQPVLIINANEVQAAHGATVGQLDPHALFYLRTRGIPHTTAQQLLSAAFCHEPLTLLDSTLADILRAPLDYALNTTWTV